LIATVEDPEAIRAILAALAASREPEAPPGAAGELPSPAACAAPERRADAAVAGVCSVASWGGGIPLDRRPAPAENPVTRARVRRVSHVVVGPVNVRTI
jgi:hypothetical protein